MITWEFDNKITWEDHITEYFTSKYKGYDIVKCKTIITTYSGNKKEKESFFLYCGSYEEQEYSNLDELLKYINGITQYYTIIKE